MRYTVLVVDDDERIARMHAAIVRRAGFSVAGVARTGGEALGAARRLSPDLLLLDIYLPDFSGIEVLRRLRATGPPLDAIVITAARDVETVREAMAGGALHYLIKPFPLTELTARLEAYAAMRSRVETARTLDQAGVDRLMGRARPERVTPPGLSDRTLSLVRRTAGDMPSDFSAAELAEASGLSRVVARRYLEHLVASGELTAAPRYGAPGRPQIRYHA